jgi:hypothetical protein
MGAYGVHLMFEIFIPTMARFGSAINPEIFVAIVCALPVMLFSLYTVRGIDVER